KGLPNSERLKKIKEYGSGKQIQLSSQDLILLERSKISIGNHSHTHPMFNRCSEEEILKELKQSKLFFDESNISGFDIFSYPNGTYDNKSEEILKNCEVIMAFLFDHIVCSKRIHPYRISRIRVNTTMDVTELKVKVSGIHSLLQY